MYSIIGGLGQTACPPGTVETAPGVCAAPPAGGQCPAGTYGTPPYCYSAADMTGATMPDVPGYGIPAQFPGAPAEPAAAGQCPAGTVGYPPLCVPMTGAGPTVPPAAPGVPAPGVPMPAPVPSMPVEPAPPVVGPPTEPAPAAAAVGPYPWSGWSGTTKMLALGAVAVGGLLLLGAFKKKKGAGTMMPNRRRKRRRSRKKGGKRASAKRYARNQSYRRRGQRTWQHAHPYSRRVIQEKCLDKGGRFYPKTGKCVGAKRKKNARRSRKTKRQAQVPYCKLTPPKKYRTQGATKAAHYALGECYKLPLFFYKAGKLRRVKSKRHILNATSRLSQRKTYGKMPMWARDKAARNIDKARVMFGYRPHRWPWKRAAAKPAQVIRLLPKAKRAKARREVALAAN